MLKTRSSSFVGTHGRWPSRRQLVLIALVFLLLAGSCAATVVMNSERLAPAVPLNVVVVGDSYTAGSGMGGNNEAGWPSIAVSRLSGDFPGLSLVTSAEGGSGYTSAGTNFFDLTKSAVSPKTDGVVIFGSRNDLLSPDVGGRVTAVLEEIHAVAPAAKVLIIGPPWVNERVPGALLRVLAEMKVSTEQGGATFVDPVAERWFFGSDSTFIGTDGIHPTDAGHQYMERKMEPTLETFLSEIETSKR